MALRIQCPGCHTAFTLPPDLAGATIRCKSCREVIRVPQANDDIPVVPTVDEPAPQHRIQSAPVRRVSPTRQPEPKPTTKAGPRSSRNTGFAIFFVLIAGAMVLVIGAGALALAALYLSDDSPTAPTNEVAAAGPPEEALQAATNGQLSAPMLKFLKELTVFVKVDTGEFEGSGSGFLVRVQGDYGYIVTNDHVVNPESPAERLKRLLAGGNAAPPIPPSRLFEPPGNGARVRAKVMVVFNSGEANEFALPAEVIDSEPERDLALLRVRAANLPRAIDLNTPAELTETTPVFVIGFPLGEILKVDNNPSVTVAPSVVTSLRRNRAQQLQEVQLQGGIHPGNSGGPVVDARGRLAGVAVAIIHGTQIAFAIPTEHVNHLLHRAKSGVRITTNNSGPDHAELGIDVQLLDLFDEVTGADLLYAPGRPPKEALNEDEPAPLPNARSMTLQANGKRLHGALNLTKSDCPGGVMAFQVQYTRKDGRREYSRAWMHPLRIAGNAPVAAAPPRPNPPRPTPPRQQPNLPLPPGASTGKIIEPTGPATPPEVTIALEEAAGQVAVGGAGRFLVLHLPKRQQLIVVDLKEGRISGTIPVNGDKVLFAAGRDHVMIYLGSGNQFQRWSLANIKQEVTTPNPIPGEIQAMAMGSASAGPLVLYAPTSAKPKPGLVLLDPLTMKEASEQLAQVKEFHRVTYSPDTFTLGISPDGRLIAQKYVFNWWLQLKKGGTWTTQVAGGSTPIPAADGRLLIDHGQAFGLDGKSLGPKRGGHGRAVWNIPALQGPLSVAFNERYQEGVREAYLKFTIHLDGEEEPLAVFPRYFPQARDYVDWLWGRPKPFERFVFFSSEFDTLALISPSRDRIDLHRISIDEMLKGSKRDYLFVLNQPNTVAARGQEYRHPLIVKSSKGGVKTQLVAGPPGMNLTADGTITWKVPANFTGREAEVSVSVRDTGGREISYRYVIDVPSP